MPNRDPEQTFDRAMGEAKRQASNVADAAGTAALANSYGLVVVAGANTIGGSAAAARNLISGNTNDGIYLSGGTDHLMKSIHDPIDARAVAFSDGTKTVVLVSVIAQGIFENYIRVARTEAEAGSAKTVSVPSDTARVS